MRARKCSVAARPAGHPSAHGWPDSGASIPQKAISHAIDLERITINHADGLGKGWKCSEREGRYQNGQFHRFWLARDCGDNAAANRCRPASVRLTECRPPEMMSQSLSTA
jgi:hypothetical protein